MSKPLSAALAAFLLVVISGCNQTDSESKTTTTTTTTTKTEATTPPPAMPPATTPGESAGGGQEITMPDGLKYVDMKVGDGALAESGKKVTVHYTGWLTDGTKFDSSVDRGQPFTFSLGAGQVIRGWDEGVKGMRIGGKRKLTIPSDLAYGDAGQGPIPAKATLVFDVELLGVE